MRKKENYKIHFNFKYFFTKAAELKASNLLNFMEDNASEIDIGPYLLLLILAVDKVSFGCFLIKYFNVYLLKDFFKLNNH